jgi:hypothetical protein
MKKIMAITFTLFLTMSLSSPALAQLFKTPKKFNLSSYNQAEDSSATGDLSPDPGTVLKLGFFIGHYNPEDPRYKEVYEKGGLMFGFSLSVNLFWKMEFRAEVNHFQNKGLTTITEEETTFTLTPIVLGVRVRAIETNKLSVYLGAGIDPFSYREKLPEHFGEDVSGSKIGYHIEAGVIAYLPRGFFIDVNFRRMKLDVVEPLYVEPFEKRIKVGAALEIRVGAGLRFNL